MKTFVAVLFSRILIQAGLFFFAHKRDYPCANHMQSLHELVLICSFNLLIKIAFAL